MPQLLGAFSFTTEKQRSRSAATKSAGTLFLCVLFAPFAPSRLKTANQLQALRHEEREVSAKNFVQETRIQHIVLQRTRRFTEISVNLRGKNAGSFFVRCPLN